MNALNFSSFETAGHAVLSFLHQRMGFDLWMLTRTEGDDWIVLQTEDHGYGVEPGTVFRWADSFCSEMVKGNGPHIAPRSDDVPAYAAAPIGQQVNIKAYVGLPLKRSDGSLFGTMCAINPTPKPDDIIKDQALVELLGGLLSTILQAELSAADEARDAERLHAEALTDALTGLYNRRGWDRLMATEEDRCRRYGNPATILMIDLDGLKQINDTQGHAAGDDLIERAGAVIRKAARVVDIVARLGGDEFGILSIECDRAGADALLKRLRAAFAEAGIRASIGLAMRKTDTGLEGAWKAADQEMYVEKRSR